MKHTIQLMTFSDYNDKFILILFINNTFIEISIMQLSQKAKYRLLQYLEDNDYLNYLTSDQEKQLLEYPANCLGTDTPQKQLISLDCQMVRTTLGQEVCLIVIVNQNQELLLHEKLKPAGQVIDYVTHITGFKKGSFDTIFQTLDNIKNKILHMIKGKILVGHDLANDLKSLKIIHKDVIDTAALIPHNQGLPNKNKLKDIVAKYLKLPIQLGVHNPFEDAASTLKLVKLHVENGRGLTRQVQGRPETLTDPLLIIKQINFDVSRVTGLFLRGSRALGYSNPDSDYDYVLVYQTNSKLDGLLIQLYNVDIAVFDSRSFDQAINEFNNISLIQLFFLSQQFQIINKIPFPKIHSFRFRQSTSEEGFRSLRKARFNLKQGNIKKALKCILVCNRFYNNYVQYMATGKIDVKATLPLWREMQNSLQQKACSDQQLFNQYLKKFQKYKDQIRKDYPYVHKIKDNIQQTVPKLNLQTPSDIDYQQFQGLLPSGQLNVICYLRKYGIDNLYSHFRVKHERHQKFPHLIQLHYHLSANFKYRIPQECRGLILDQKKNYQVVACPYFKFFDYVDKFCPIKSFDWQNSQIFQKFDGSICTLYYYDGWNLASSSKPDGNGNYCFSRKETTTVFRLQFWRIFYNSGYQLPLEQDQDKTFIFQLMSMNHIIVVHHLKDQIVLHGCIKTKTFEEQPIQQYQSKYHWKVAKSLLIKYRQIEDIVALCQKLNPRVQQGYILKDKNNLRIKVKSSNYLRANFVNPINHNIVDRNFLSKLIINNQHQHFVEYCPEWKPHIDKILVQIKNIIEVTFSYLQRNSELSKKELFLSSQKLMDGELLYLVMMVKNYNLTRQNFVQKIQLNKLIKVLDMNLQIKNQ